MEKTLAFHTTGRSAATWISTYGNETVRALTAASHGFLVNPPEHLYGHPLAAPHGLLWIGRTGQATLIEELHATVVGLTPEAQVIDGATAVSLNPLLRPGYVEAALVEPGMLALDVAALHLGYVKGLRALGGVITVVSPVIAAEWIGWAWVLSAGGEQHVAPVVVNAAGAWADRVGALFGASPIGLVPKRRTVFMVSADGLPRAPMTYAVDDSFYIKFDAGQYLCSPAEATPQEPGNARPDELEIARAIDAINEATTLGIRSIRASWAGQRSFVPDNTPVIGYDPQVEGLFWYAGQGGYGIQSAPAAARLGASLAAHGLVPADITATGLNLADLSPARLG
jgi:D-arginine dehydrogenase